MLMFFYIQLILIINFSNIICKFLVQNTEILSKIIKMSKINTII